MFLRKKGRDKSREKQPEAKIIDKINSPSDLKGLNYSELQQLCSEIRELIINQVSKSGGHIGPNLGVVELTVALHRMFESPRDKIIWDVGHQCYTHKILTGRKNLFHTLRQFGGISGFPDRNESPHDVFSTGHAGTSISAALGMALARDLNKDNYHVVAVIGDGAMNCGMAYEALNHAGHLNTNLLVVLNDNGMAISPTVGAISKRLNMIRTNYQYLKAKQKIRQAVFSLPGGRRLHKSFKRFKRGIRAILFPTMTWWEELGFTYLGPVDGHNIAEIESALKRAKKLTGPVLLHVLTTKGKGYKQAEEDPVSFHQIPPAMIDGFKKKIASYSEIFAQTLRKLLISNQKVVAITPAMLKGSGLASLVKEFPDRIYDTGICEQHTVTLAAGLAAQGFIPIATIYSTFLQRAYDQIIHDVCLPDLRVVLAVDRGGIVGDDGKTHQGIFDLSYLSLIPNMIVSAPKDENELQHLLYTATRAEHPMAVRYPRGQALGVELDEEFHEIPIGKGEVLRKGEDIAILAIGSTVVPSLEAAELLASYGIYPWVVNARFVKPLDKKLILKIAKRVDKIVTVEENTLSRGFGAGVLELLANCGISDVKVKRLGIPDEFVTHGKPELLRSLYHLDAEGIAKECLDFTSK